MAKYRSAESYHGRTVELKENQRGNLVPGGPWQKRRIAELRLLCWWEGADLESKQFVYEGYINKRDSADISMGELKDEKFLDAWWSDLELGNKNEGTGKKYLYWAIMNPLSKKEKAPILKNTRECLNEKLALINM